MGSMSLELSKRYFHVEFYDKYQSTYVLYKYSNNISFYYNFFNVFDSKSFFYVDKYFFALFVINGIWFNALKDRSPLVLEGLRSGTDYEVFISAINSHGVGSPSPRLVFRTDVLVSKIKIL